MKRALEGSKVPPSKRRPLTEESQSPEDPSSPAPESQSLEEDEAGESQLSDVTRLLQLFLESREEFKSFIDSNKQSQNLSFLTQVIEREQALDYALDRYKKQRTMVDNLWGKDIPGKSEEGSAMSTLGGTGNPPNEPHGLSEEQAETIALELVEVQQLHNALSSIIVQQIQTKSKKRNVRMAMRRNNTHSQTLGADFIPKQVISGRNMSTYSQNARCDTQISRDVGWVIDTLTYSGITLSLSTDTHTLPMTSCYTNSDMEEIEEFTREFIRSMETLGFCVYVAGETKSGNPIPKICDPMTYSLGIGIVSSTREIEYRVIKTPLNSLSAYAMQVDSSDNAIKGISDINLGAGSAFISMDRVGSIWEDAFLSITHHPTLDGRLTSPVATAAPLVADASVLRKCFIRQVIGCCTQKLVAQDAGMAKGIDPLLDAGIANAMGIPKEYGEGNFLSDGLNGIDAPSPFEIDQASIERLKRNQEDIAKNIQKILDQRNLYVAAMQGSVNEFKLAVANAPRVPQGMKIDSIKEQPVSAVHLQAIELLSSQASQTMGSHAASATSFRQYAPNAGLQQQQQQQALSSKQHRIASQLSHAFTNATAIITQLRSTSLFDSRVQELFSDQYSDTTTTRELDALIFFIKDSKNITKEAQVKFEFSRKPRVSFNEIVDAYRTGITTPDEFITIGRGAIGLASNNLPGISATDVASRESLGPVRPSYSTAGDRQSSIL